MTLTIDLRPELEAALTRRAAERGLSLRDHVCALLEAAERAAVWVESARNLPHTPVLSDEAMSRESMYDDERLYP